jgi:hypothetical protein
MKHLIQLDGPLPNLALMRLSSHFKANGEEVHLHRAQVRNTNAGYVFDGPKPDLFSGAGAVYGSSIFEKSAPLMAQVEREWGPVHWGGTGVRVESSLSEVDPSVDWEGVTPDYSTYPLFKPSLGFTQRGCRLKCGFCVVPKKEGSPRAVRTIAELWRGEPHQKKLHLLDNDFFGQPKEEWRARLHEIRSGGFRVCFSQGINIRLVDEESARELANLEYRDDSFQRRQLYTAWDNFKERGVFTKGVKTLEEAGIPPRHLMVYMLIGYRRESWAEIHARFDQLVALGCKPYPMVFEERKHPQLKALQRWTVQRTYLHIPWATYCASGEDRRLAVMSEYPDEGQPEVAP